MLRIPRDDAHARSEAPRIWRGSLVAAAFFAAAAAALPPPPDQQVAACDAPVYATDQLVCGDAELAAMDQAVSSILRELPAELVDSPPPFIESQRDWFGRRSRCAFEREGRACTQDAYAERMAVLGTFGAGVSVDRLVRCTGELAGNPLGLSVNQNLVVLTDPGLNIVLIALEPDAHSPWQAFVEVTGEDARTFTRIDGTVLSCQ